MLKKSYKVTSDPSPWFDVSVDKENGREIPQTTYYVGLPAIVVRTFFEEFRHNFY